MRGVGVRKGADVMNRGSSRVERRAISALAWCGIRRGRVRV